MKNWLTFESDLALKTLEIDENGEKDFSFESDFLALYNESAKDNYHWQYCTLNVYKSNFDSRFESFKKEYPDAELIDFIENELKDCQKVRITHYDGDEPLYTESEYRYFEHKIKQLLSPKALKMFSMPQEKKIKYLEELKNNIENDFTGAEPNEEFSENSTIEKIVALHELGILDFLYKRLPKNINDTEIGKLIALFSGIKPDDVRRYVSSIKTGDIPRNKNYPLKEKNINSFKSELIKLKLLEIFYPKK